MTIEEFYKWAIRNDCENKQVVIYGHDDNGRHVKNWLDESDLRRLNVSVAVNCRWQTGVKTSRVER
ncbi:MULTISPECIES: hypothetical protein [Bacillota]|uniref:hypothetical protein n=1 Tax=Bacillota TaxID=1239 RepID=UPI002053A1AB|nr:MAG TPA: hypothetical protein [Caudoviricetes sp.]